MNNLHRILRFTCYFKVYYDLSCMCAMATVGYCIIHIDDSSTIQKSVMFSFFIQFLAILLSFREMFLSFRECFCHSGNVFVIPEMFLSFGKCFCHSGKVFVIPGNVSVIQEMFLSFREMFLSFRKCFCHSGNVFVIPEMFFRSL